MMELCETCIKNGTNECSGHIVYMSGENHFLSCTGYEEEKAMEKEFTKADLKDRMVVETRDGKRFLVCGDILIGKDRMIDLSWYNDDMIYIGSLVWSRDSYVDIVKVYDKANTLKQVEHISCLPIIWERHVIKEVTLKEIAEKFGVDEVKVIEA